MVMAIRMLSDDEVRRWLDPAELLDALARGFTALSAGEVVAPPRNGVDVEGGCRDAGDCRRWRAG